MAPYLTLSQIRTLTLSYNLVDYDGSPPASGDPNPHTNPNAYQGMVSPRGPCF